MNTTRVASHSTEQRHAGRPGLPAVVLLLACALTTGCASSTDREGRVGVNQYLQGNFAGARATLRPLASKTDENFVLNNVRLGSAALVDCDLNEAEKAFLAAYEVLNSVGVNDGGRTLGAVLVDEKLRIWRGEPFERAMANFYLGLIYYMRGDYGNARGAFENSLFKLRDYGEGANKDDAYRDVESNFALGYLMLAKSWQRLGEPQKAEQNFDRVKKLRSYLAPVADPVRNERSNLLLVVDFGYGAKKVTDFDGAIAGFAPKPEEVGPVPPPWVTVDGTRYMVDDIGRPPVDLLALAQDRKWQSLDTIRTIKSAVGTGLIGVGAYEASRSRNSKNQAAGLAMIGAGLLLKATSQADTRQWEMLPRSTFILPLEVPPGTHEVTVQFPNVPGLTQTWRGLTVPAKGEAVYYIRMQRYHTGPYVWPPVQPAPLASAP